MRSKCHAQHSAKPSSSTCNFIAKLAKRNFASLSRLRERSGERETAEQNKKARLRGLFFPTRNRLRSLNVGSLLAFRTLNDVKGNLLAFFEGFEAAHVDCGEMREQIFAAIIRSNETKTFCIVEPLYCTVCHVTSLTKKPGGFPSNCLNSKTAHGKTSNACNLIQTPTRFLLLFTRYSQVVIQLF